MNVAFEKYSDGLVPAIVQDADTRAVLMLGFMNEEALAATETSGRVTFYSRSKQRLWEKGETSGNTLRVRSVKLDCDRDALLIEAEPAGPVCHTGEITCFGPPVESVSSQLAGLQRTIRERRGGDPQVSYVAGLFSHGINKIAQKVGEEAVELVIEAKDEDREKFVGEAADLLFHYLVLLEAKSVTLDDITAELAKRRRGPT